MTAEWMPVNPCPCGTIRYPDGHKCNAEDGECSPLAYYEGAVDYQKKLLEYLPMYSIKQGNIEGIDCWCIPKSRLIEMRKQLEAK